MKTEGETKEIVVVTSKGKFAHLSYAAVARQLQSLAPCIVETIYERTAKVYSKDSFPELYA